MASVQTIDLTQLQATIIDIASEHPGYTYKEIADSCDCATSTVGRTLRTEPLPDRNRLSVEATTSVDEHKRLYWHATVDAIAQVGSLIQTIERRERDARRARTKIEHRLEQVKEQVADDLRTELTSTPSVKMIRKVVKRRLRYYPTTELFSDVGDIASAKESLNTQHIESLRNVLSELTDRCTAIMKKASLSSPRRDKYTDAVEWYRRERDELNAAIQKWKGVIIDPKPVNELEADIEQLREEQIRKTAHVIHESITSDTEFDTVIARYPTLACQVTPTTLVNDQGFGEPLYPRRVSRKELRQIHARLQSLFNSCMFE